jgi:hypothetical protein
LESPYRLGGVELGTDTGAVFVKYDSEIGARQTDREALLKAG